MIGIGGMIDDASALHAAVSIQNGLNDFGSAALGEIGDRGDNMLLLHNQ